MPGLLIVLLGFAKGLRQSLGDPEFRAIALMVAVLLAVGTVFYSNVEGWSLLDAMYFSMITLTTVGYGDLAPRTAAGKLSR
jgi:voltage-gated potassium channel